MVVGVIIFLLLLATIVPRIIETLLKFFG